MVSLVSSVIGVIKDLEKRNGTAVWRFHYFFVPLQTVRGGIRDKVNKKYVFDYGINCIKRSTNEHTQALGFHEDGRRG